MSNIIAIGQNGRPVRPIPTRAHNVSFSNANTEAADIIKYVLHKIDPIEFHKTFATGLKNLSPLHLNNLVAALKSANVVSDLDVAAATDKTLRHCARCHKGYVERHNSRNVCVIFHQAPEVRQMAITAAGPLAEATNVRIHANNSSAFASISNKDHDASGAIVMPMSVEVVYPCCGLTTKVGAAASPCFIGRHTGREEAVVVNGKNIRKFPYTPAGTDLDPSVHLEQFFAIPPPSYEYFPWGPFHTSDQFNRTLIEGRIQPNPACVLFAIYDKTKVTESGNKDGAIAGVIGFCDASAANLHAEIAFVMTSPPFQRTHVTSNAIGLLLHWALDLPSEGGLGLRRVVWKASPLNEKSVNAAERMGFTKEGILRWNWVLPEGKVLGGNGKERREGDPRKNSLGRDTVVLSLCWDDWEPSGRARVDAVMARTA
ncbi:hypothetical protein DXG03_002075 [Asterophora parasitica]|uniref:N-acetyltransferase domain-containing protein n=1 Tax=Asterophora parasitica TaxID=117018 RepID=A0A9P7G496_9AGAR|nr:hypothetical protein DXG03_002075 [Asterophora parasitica]